MNQGWAKSLGLLVAGVVSGLAASAHAQAVEPGASAPEAAPAVAPEAAPAAAPLVAPDAGPPPGVAYVPAEQLADETVHNHDGFFLRMDLGIGSSWYTEKNSGTELGTATGITGMFALRLGGTIFPGFVLGGGIVGNSMVNPTYKDARTGNSSKDSNVSIGLSELQLFALYYPNPKGGFHVMGSCGYGSLSVTVNGVQYNTSLKGLVVGGGVGYDFWVSPQWSLGPSLVLTHGIMSATETSTAGNVDFSATFTAPVVAFTATYH